MKRGFASLAAIMAIALMVPTAGHAEYVSVECDGVYVDGAGSCSQEFLLDESDMTISLLGTHGAVHQIGADAEVAVQWYSGETLAAEFSCSSPGLVPPLDEQSLLCSQGPNGDGSYDVNEIQTLVVTVVTADCDNCTLHGGIVFKGAGDLI